jgi:hypothetical protein
MCRLLLKSKRLYLVEGRETTMFRCSFAISNFIGVAKNPHLVIMCPY